MRPLPTVLGFAAVTAAAVLSLCASRNTYADPPQTFFQSGEVDDVTFTGTVERDPQAKGGWALKVTLENRGDAEESAHLDTELTKTLVNPASRATPPGVALWHRVEKVAVPAHESVVRSYDVPAWMAVQLTAAEKAAERRDKLAEQESAKPSPNFALTMRPYTLYGVAFRALDG